MYVKRIILENVGPIPLMDLELPFDEAGNPKPVVLVGKNGSGKSVALSFVVNALLSARQAVFEDIEVEKGKVYKYRSPSYIRSGEHYYYGSVSLENGFEVTEWQLDAERKTFEETNLFVPSRKSWANIPENEANYFSENFTGRKIEIRKLLNSNCLLYFPPNRFEEPAWLNYDNLLARAQFIDLKRIAGISNRQCIQYAPLTINKNWILDVLFDRFNYEKKIQEVALPNNPQLKVNLFLGYQGWSSTLYDTIIYLLKVILREEDELRLGIGPRRNRAVALMKGDNHLLSNIFQLSSGEVLVFNLVLSILRDFDLSGSQFNNIADIRGLVVVDEIDLHLHADFQHTVLPKLLKLFPKVQFIITSHSPLFLMGMKNEYGEGGVAIISMPEGKAITVEQFEEFEHAYNAYKKSVKYEHDLSEALRNASKPVLFFEGATDIKYFLKAAQLFGEEELIKTFTLNDGEGYGGLNKIWSTFNSHVAKVVPGQIVLIYDCDKQKESASHGQLTRWSIPLVEENPIKKGIENLFSRTTLEKAQQHNSAYIDIMPALTKRYRGINVEVQEVWDVNPDEKSNMCDWFCEHGSADDFQGFRKIFDMVQKIIKK